MFTEHGLNLDLKEALSYAGGSVKVTDNGLVENIRLLNLPLLKLDTKEFSVVHGRLSAEEYLSRCRPLSQIHIDRGWEPYPEAWSTYKDCKEAKLQHKDGSLVLEVTVWDGENLHGTRTDIRFTANFCVSFDREQEVLSLFKEAITRKVIKVAENEYKDYLENKKNICIKDRIKHLEQGSAKQVG